GAPARAREALWPRATFAAASWIVVSLTAILLLYQHVMLINRVAMPKSPEALLDRAGEALKRLGYAPDIGYSARGVGFSLDYANYLARTSNDRNRWDLLAGSRTEAFHLWRRTNPRTIVPFSDSGGVMPYDPPMTVGGMTLTAVDAFGRLGQFIAVPAPN